MPKNITIAHVPAPSASSPMAAAVPARLAIRTTVMAM